MHEFIYHLLWHIHMTTQKIFRHHSIIPVAVVDFICYCIVICTVSRLVGNRFESETIQRISQKACSLHLNTIEEISQIKTTHYRKSNVEF